MLASSSLTNTRQRAYDEDQMMPYKYTVRGLQAVVSAYQAAYDRHRDYLGTEHLLLGIIADETDPVIALLLRSAPVSCADVRDHVEAIIGRPAIRPRLAHLPLTPNVHNVFRHSHGAAVRLNYGDINTRHLACGLLASPSTATQILSGCGLDVPGLHQHLHR